MEDFTVSIPQRDLDDLRERLARTRWPSDLGAGDALQGMSTSYLRELADYWCEEFDWRAAERRINEFRQHRVQVSGVPVHFIREPGKGPAPIPLILSHGWPWSFWDWQKVIGPLADPAAFGGDSTDAFEVIVPSLPEFGFSTPTGRTDLNFWKMADLWHELMTRVLGYSRYAAGGGDYGAMVTGQLGHKYAESLIGLWLAHPIHLDTFQGQRPWDVTGGTLVPDGADPDIRRGALKLQQRFASHVAVHMLDPQTLSYGMADSPVGMLAWLLRRWSRWSDPGEGVESVFPRDHMLTNATIWWSTGTFTSALRCWINANRYPWTPAHGREPVVEAPTGFTFLGHENPPGVTTEDRSQVFLDDSEQRRWFNPVHTGAHERGGHFTPWENPAAVIEDIRATFRKLR